MASTAYRITGPDAWPRRWAVWLHPWDVARHPEAADACLERPEQPVRPEQVSAEAAEASQRQGS